MPGNGTTETPSHPAVPQGQVVTPPTGPTTAQEADARSPKQAHDIKVAVERKATLCVRIAQAVLKDATVEEIEVKAMELLDIPDAQIAATAATLSITAEAEKEEDQDEASDEDDDAKMSNKKANKEITSRLDKMEKNVGKIVKAFGDFFGMDDMDDMDGGELELDMMLEEDPNDMSDEDLMAMLTTMGDDADGDGIDQNAPDYGHSAQDESEMLSMLMAELETDVTASDAQLSVEPLAKGPSIQSGEGGNVSPDPAPVTPEVEQMVSASENDIQMAAGDIDPMGLMDESVTASSSPNDDLLALYADLDLPKSAKKADDDEDEDDEDEDDDDDDDAEVVEEEEVEVEAGKKAGRTASKPAQRPVPKKANAGAKTLGAVPHNKQAQNEIDELSKIWEQAPDVREFFGIPKN
jgi:hypothetical protein